MTGDDQPGSPAHAIIRRRWPSISRQLTGQPHFRPLELDVSGPAQTLRANGLRLASAWQPDVEAALQIAHLPEQLGCVTLYGVGLAYLPPLLLQRISPTGRLQVVLMNRQLFATMLDVIDQTAWLSVARVELLLPEQASAPAEHIAVTTALLELADPAAQRLRDQLWQRLSDDHVTHAQHALGAHIAANMLANESTIAADPDVCELWRHGGGDRADAGSSVVVGAGPSLDRSLPRIRALQAAGARIVTVDAALASLVAGGVLPDVVVSLDPMPAIRRFYELDLSTLHACSLVYFPMVDPGVVQLWPWTRHAAYTAHDRFDALRARLPRTSLFSSGSVIHPAIDIAVRFGSSTIYLAGADFCHAFACTHAGDSAFNQVLDGDTIGAPTVTDYRGRSVPSMLNLISYYRDAEAFIASHRSRGRRFINLGQYSARMHGVAHEPIAA